MLQYIQYEILLKSNLFLMNFEVFFFFDKFSTVHHIRFFFLKSEEIKSKDNVRKCRQRVRQDN